MEQLNIGFKMILGLLINVGLGRLMGGLFIARFGGKFGLNRTMNLRRIVLFVGAFVWVGAFGQVSGGQVAGGQVTGGQVTGGQVTAAKDTSIKIFGLKDCIQLALSQSTQVLKGNYALEQAGLDVLLSYGQFLPDLNFVAGYNFTGGRTDYYSTVPTLVDATRSGFNYQLVSSVNLFTGLQNKSALKAALLRKEGASVSLDHAKQQIAFDVTQAYLQVVLDKQLLVFANENLAISYQRVDLLKELTAVGRKVKSDLYQQEAATSADKLYSISAENNLRKDELALFRKLRLNNAKGYAVGDYQQEELNTRLTEEQENQLIVKGIGQRGDLKAAQLNADAATWAITKAKAGFIPKLNLTYGIYQGGAYDYSLAINGINSMPNSQPGLGNQLFKQVNGLIGLSTSWAIYDKNFTKTAIASSKINLANAQLDAGDIQLDIVTQLQQAVGDFNAALQEVETAGKGFDAAKEAFDLIEGRYKLGSATLIELQNVQATLLQAKENKEQRALNLQLKKLVLDYLSGK